MSFGKKARKRTKIALVGTAGTALEAPYSDDNWDIWTWNRPGLDLAGVYRWDRLFEIHRKWGYEGAGEQRYLDRLRTIRLPQKVVSTVRLSDDPANIVLDRDDMFKRWGAIWLSSSITWAFANALDEKPEEIGLWGINMESREEYIVQFAGVRHFIALAKERGVKITVAEHSNLLREPMPYPDRFETVLALTLEETAGRLKRMIERQAPRARLALRALGQEEGRYLDTENHDVEAMSIGIAKRHDKLYQEERALNLLKGQLWATQVYRRMFVWNAELPQIGDTDEFDIEDIGPI